MTTLTAAASPATMGDLVFDCMPAGVPLMFHQPVVTVPVARVEFIDLL